MMDFYVYLLFSIVGVQALNRKNPWDFKGTTPAIKDIFIGRCYAYLEITPANRKESLTVNVDCPSLWETFRNTWAGKDPCKIDQNSYRPFFEMIDTNKTVTDQLLFYSGLPRLSGDLTAVNDDYFRLEDTLSGFIANNIKWCGCIDDGKTKGCVLGINYGNCKASSKCSTINPFWAAASKNFAKKAQGTASVMMNGTKRGNNTAYHKRSYFTRFELPTLGKMHLVNKLVIFVAFDLGVKPKEKCGSGTGTGSIAKLIIDAKKYGIQTVECIDNPRMIWSILCAKHPNAAECPQDAQKKSTTRRKFLSLYRLR